MYQPEYIKIKNFGSISDLNYNFKTGVSQVIQGKNLEDKGQKSNGVGKSSFNDAVGFGISGISLRGLNMDELIRDGEKEAYLELSLKTIDSTKTLLIKRSLERKKSQLVEVFLNGVALHHADHDVNARNKSIIDQLDITKEDLFQFFIITKERFKPYFKMSDNEKKEITNRFSKADRVDKVFPKLEKDLKENEAKLLSTRTAISQLQGRCETYKSEKDNYESGSVEKKEKLKETLREAISNRESAIHVIDSNAKLLTEFIVTKNQEIEAVRNKIISSEDIEVKEKIRDELDVALKEAERKVTAANDVIAKELAVQDKLKIRLSKELKELNDSLHEVQELFSQTESKLRSSINCPSCYHEFILDSEETVDQLKATVKECNEIIKDIDLDIISKKEEIQKCNDEIDALNEQIRTLNVALRKSREENQKQEKIIRDYIVQTYSTNSKLRNSIFSIETDISKINNQIKSEEHMKGIHINQIAEFKQNLIDADKEIDNKEAIERYDKLILDSENELIDLNLQQDNNTKESQRINSWIIRFKSFKSFLANQSIKNIEDLTNTYLSKMNTDLSIEISSHDKKKKDVKEKITEKILRSGFPVGSYGRFSGGERGRIDFALILANQTLINSNSNQGLDFILIDEVLESLDSLGIESIIKAMDGIDKTLLLVTQNEINSLPKQTLTFIKKNGSTEIE